MELTKKQKERIATAASFKSGELISDMNKIKVKKLHPDAVLPCRAKKGDAGYDLVAVDGGTIVRAGQADEYVEYKTGIAIEPPLGYHVEIFPRSSISNKKLILANSIGLSDNAYRGELIVRFRILKGKVGEVDHKQLYQKGDRIAQLVIRKTESKEFVWADELSETDRASGGFGSTGK